MATVVSEDPDTVLARLRLDRDALAALCRANGVRSLAVFGSAVRADFDATRSDLDFVVEIEAPTCVDYADRYFALRDGLERLAGRPVDLLTGPSLTNPYLKDDIERTKVVLHAA